MTPEQNSEGFFTPENLANLSEKGLRLIFHLYWPNHWVRWYRWSHGLFDYNKKEFVNASESLRGAETLLKRYYDHMKPQIIILKNPFYEPNGGGDKT